MKRVAIIGAGPMGLSLAYYLRSRAHTVVYEAGPVPGGMSANFDFDGVEIEKYYHFINLPDEHLFTLLADLGMEDELRWQPTKMGFFRMDSDGENRLYDWGNPVALLKLADIPLLTRFRYGLHAFCCKFIKDLTPLDDLSAADWFRRWEGEQGYTAFWRFLFEKKFFELADPLSAAWIASRIRRVANSRKSLMEESLGYLSGGSASLINRLIIEIRAQNGEVRLDSAVERITSDNGKGGAEVFSKGLGEYFEVDASPAPLPYLDFLPPDLPDASKIK
mgnify:FL=1